MQARTVPGEFPEDGGRWVPIREAARLLGRDPKAIRARIERGTLRWRPAGNHGREVYVTPDMETPAEDVPGELPRDAPGEPAETVSLMVQAARLEEERLAAAATRESDLRALADELRARAERAEAALAESRRPWLAKVLEGLRRKG
jgi:hypothetical protein